MAIYIVQVGSNIGNIEGYLEDALEDRQIFLIMGGGTQHFGDGGGGGGTPGVPPTSPQPPILDNPA